MSPRIALLFLVLALAIFLGYSGYIMGTNAGVQPLEALTKAAQERMVLYAVSGLIIVTLVLTYFGLPTKQKEDSKAYIAIFAAGILAVSPLFLSLLLEIRAKLSVVQSSAITNSLVILGILAIILLSTGISKPET